MLEMNQNNGRNTGRPAAEAFLNISVPASTDSGQAKLGKGIALMADKQTEAFLVQTFKEAVAKGKEAEFNAWLKDQLIIDFRLNKTGGAAPAMATPDFLSVVNTPAATG